MKSTTPEVSVETEEKGALRRDYISADASPLSMDTPDEDSSSYVTWTIYTALAFPQGNHAVLNIYAALHPPSLTLDCV